jgi:hypothetical protein
MPETTDPSDPTCRTDSPAVIYRALIRVELEESSLELVNPIDRSGLAVNLSKRPEFHLDPWPDQPSSGDEDITRYALFKLKALFDFGPPSLPIGTADEMRSAVHEQFPAAERARTDKTRYKIYNISAFILENGQTGWRIDVPGVGEELPGLPFALDGSDLELFIQNLVRVDLKVRLEALDRDMA